MPWPTSRMALVGRFLPVAILSSDRLVIGESRHSSKEFIYSVRPSLNDRFRLEADRRLLEFPQAGNDPQLTFVLMLH